MEENVIKNDIIEGRNAVIEALRAGRAIDKIFIAKGDVDKTLGHIASKARSAGIVVVEADRRKLDFMSQTHAHQGVVALAAVREYCTVDDIFAIAEERREAPFIIVCDEISDPHNLGAIIRSAECVGAHGVIIPKRRSAGLTAIVDKASAGAAEHMAIARVPNLPAAIKDIKARGVWVYGTAADGQSDLWHTDLSGAVALVIGSEGDGMGRLVAESCDFVISLPMRGLVSSLNASTAAAISHAVRGGRPLISRVLTVGGKVATGKNLRVRLGTGIGGAIAFCGGAGAGVNKVILGGPMMGQCAYDLHTPVTKGVSGILLLADSAPGKPQGNCMRCGGCVDACPVGLVPLSLYALANKGLYGRARDEQHLMDCIECGACAYQCPARLPLVQAIRAAKGALRRQQAR